MEDIKNNFDIDNETLDSLDTCEHCKSRKVSSKEEPCNSCKFNPSNKKKREETGIHCETCPDKEIHSDEDPCFDCLTSGPTIKDQE
jgi:hypothetical protein